MRSKFFRICICVALCLCLFTGVFAFMGWGSLLRQVGSAVIYPFSWVAGKVGYAVSGFSDYFRDIDEMKEENQALREENESLRAGLLDAEILEDENSWLYRYLSMKREREDWELCSAYVTATEWAGGEGGSTYAVTLTLNKGSSSGITAGMPVVTEVGLVGMVSEVSVGFCRVRTLLHTDFAAGAIDSRSGETGLWSGSFSVLPSGGAMVTSMAAEADVTAGDVILTSGKGGVYPYGIPVGRVKGVYANAYSRTTEAEVLPFVNFKDLRQVMVLTDYVHYTGDNFPGGLP